MPPNLHPRRIVEGIGTLAEGRPPDIFELSRNERQSDIWLKLKRELNKRLEVQRAENDRPLDTEATARVRGHIECLKAVLAMGDEPPTHDE
jgi:hypothetical protein